MIIRAYKISFLYQNFMYSYKPSNLDTWLHMICEVQSEYFYISKQITQFLLLLYYEARVCHKTLYCIMQNNFDIEKDDSVV